MFRTFISIIITVLGAGVAIIVLVASLSNISPQEIGQRIPAPIPRTTSTAAQTDTVAKTPEHTNNGPDKAAITDTIPTAIQEKTTQNTQTVKEPQEIQEAEVPATTQESYKAPLIQETPPQEEPTQATEHFSATAIVSLTNDARAANGRSTLSHNSTLDVAAQEKLAHMFQEQYFAHVSPSGIEPVYWVKQADYAFRSTGENLAMGDFFSNDAIVTGWMNSPGHRKNILNPDFTEIGVAVDFGIYNGRRTLMAVQVFGTPLPDCDAPNDAQEDEINRRQAEVDALAAELERLKAEMEQTSRRSPKYNDLVEEYNATAEIYNSKLTTLKALVDTYNESVHAYNACMEG